jgi:hypothetical protein
MAKGKQRADQSARVVIEGVPQVSFYESGPRCPEDVPFPSCVRAILEHMGSEYGCKHVPAGDKQRLSNCTYAYVMGTSGAAFRLLWKPGWFPDNIDPIVMAEDGYEPYRRGLESVGFASEILDKRDGVDQEPLFRQRIIESIRDRGRPVIAFGVIGPPECCLVTGYHDGGDVLIGWSFFQRMPEFSADVALEPSGCFRKRDWYKDTPRLIILGEKRPAPPLGGVYREALTWGLKVMRTPMVRGRHNGFAAYDAWAEHLLQDEEFAAADMDRLNWLFMVHDDSVCTVAEGRWYGAEFLKEIVEHEPALADDLGAAAACFVKEHDLMWEIWGKVGGIGRSDEKSRTLAEPEVRRQIIPIIRAARDRDIEAAGHIERALARNPAERSAC